MKKIVAVYFDVYLQKKVAIVSKLTNGVDVSFQEEDTIGPVVNDGIVSQEGRKGEVEIYVQNRIGGDSLVHIHTEVPRITLANGKSVLLSVTVDTRVVPGLVEHPWREDNKVIIPTYFDVSTDTTTCSVRVILDI